MATTEQDINEKRLQGAQAVLDRGQKAALEDAPLSPDILNLFRSVPGESAKEDDTGFLDTKAFFKGMEVAGKQLPEPQGRMGLRGIKYLYRGLLLPPYAIAWAANKLYQTPGYEEQSFLDMTENVLTGMKHHSWTELIPNLRLRWTWNQKDRGVFVTPLTMPFNLGDPFLELAQPVVVKPFEVIAPDGKVYEIPGGEYLPPGLNPFLAYDVVMDPWWLFTMTGFRTLGTAVKATGKAAKVLPLGRTIEAMAKRVINIGERLEGIVEPPGRIARKASQGKIQEGERILERQALEAQEILKEVEAQSVKLAHDPVAMEQLDQRAANAAWKIRMSNILSLKRKGGIIFDYNYRINNLRHDVFAMEEMTLKQKMKMMEGLDESAAQIIYIRNNLKDQEFALVQRAIYEQKELQMYAPMEDRIMLTHLSELSRPENITLLPKESRNPARWMERIRKWRLQQAEEFTTGQIAERANALVKSGRLSLPENLSVAKRSVQSLESEAEFTRRMAGKETVAGKEVGRMTPQKDELIANVKEYYWDKRRQVITDKQAWDAATDALWRRYQDRVKNSERLMDKMAYGKWQRALDEIISKGMLKDVPEVGGIPTKEFMNFAGQVLKRKILKTETVESIIKEMTGKMKPYTRELLARGQRELAFTEQAYLEREMLNASVLEDFARETGYNWIQHVGVKRNWTAWKEASEKVRSAGRTIAGRAQIQKRVATRGLSIREANRLERARKKRQLKRLGVPEKFAGKMSEKAIRLEEDYARILALNHLDRDYRLAAWDYMAGVRRILNEKEALIRLKPGQAAPPGFRRVQIKREGKLIDHPLFSNKAVPKTIADDFEKTLQVFFYGDPKEVIQALGAIHGAIKSTWINLTLPLFPGYHIRNAISNGILAWTAGMPISAILKYYGDASEILLRTKWAGFLRSPKYLPQSKLRTTLQKGGKLDPRLEKHFQNYQGIGGFRTGFFEQEQLTASGRRGISTAVPQTMTGKQYLSDVIKSLPSPTRNILVRTGWALGGFIDDQARLAHYMWQVEKGKTSAQAFQRTMEVLYPFHRKTWFEKNVSQNVFWFYNWTRRNLVGVIRQLLDQPGRTAQIPKAIEGLSDAFADDLEYVEEYHNETNPGYFMNRSTGNYYGAPMRYVHPGSDMAIIFGPKAFFREMELQLTPFKVFLENAFDYDILREKPQDFDFERFIVGVDVGGELLRLGFSQDMTQDIVHLIRSFRIVNAADVIGNRRRGGWDRIMTILFARFPEVNEAKVLTGTMVELGKAKNELKREIRSVSMKVAKASELRSLGANEHEIRKSLPLGTKTVEEAVGRIEGLKKLLQDALVSIRYWESEKDRVKKKEFFRKEALGVLDKEAGKSGLQIIRENNESP